MAVLLSLGDHVHDFAFVRHMHLCHVLQEGLALVFADLQLGLAARVKQVVDRLVVDLNILALHLELDLLDALVPEHRLVVEVVLARRGSLRAGWCAIGAPLRQHVSVLDLADLLEEVLEAAREDALLVLAFASLDRKCLARAGLAVGEHASVVAEQALVDNGAADVLKNIDLRSGLPSDIVKGKLLVLAVGEEAHARVVLSRGHTPPFTAIHIHCLWQKETLST